MRRTPALAVTLGIAVLAGLGCPSRDDGQGTSSQTSTTNTPQSANPCSPPSPIESMTRGAFRDWAEDVGYATPDSSRGYAWGFGPGDYVEIVANPGPDSSQLNGCMLGRLVLQQARPQLGLGVGPNYLWADSTPGGYRTLVIPQDASIAPTTHPLTPHQHQPGTPAPQPVGAYGTCKRCYVGKIPYWCNSPYGTPLQPGVRGPAAGRFPDDAGPALAARR